MSQEQLSPQAIDQLRGDLCFLDYGTKEEKSGAPIDDLLRRFRKKHGIDGQAEKPEEKHHLPTGKLDKLTNDLLQQEIIRVQRKLFPLNLPFRKRIWRWFRGLFTCKPPLGDAKPGRADEVTTQALQDFQQIHGLEQTGCLDPETCGLFPVSFEEQHEVELEAIKEFPCPSRRAGKNRDSADMGQTKDAARQALDMDLFGLALSGGGIRSATFNLGVIQGLARLDLLHQVDYLSTVSGGGYIGSWLSAWIRREQGRVEEVELCLAGKKKQDCAANSAEAASTPSGPETEPLQVQWLRRFSNFLTPRMGLLSADTLTAVTTYLRNLILNQITLVSLTAGLLTLPWVFLGIVRFLEQSPTVWHWGPLILSVLLGLLGTGLAGYHSARMSADCAAESVRRRRPWQIWGLCVGTAIIFGITLPLTAQLLSKEMYLFFWAAASIGLAWVIGLRTAIDSCGNGISTYPRAGMWGGIVTLVAGFPLMYGCLWFIERLGHRDDLLLHLIIWGPIVFLAITMLVITLHLGLVGRGYRDHLREWWSRLTGLLFKSGLGWLFVTATALYGPFLVLRLEDWLAMGGALWLVTTAAGVLAAFSGKTGGPGASLWLERLVKVVPYIFAAGLFIAVSYGLYQGLMVLANHGVADLHVCKLRESVPGESPVYRIETAPSGGFSAEVVALTPVSSCGFATYAAQLDLALDKKPWISLIALLSFLSIVGVMGLRVDINIFSLHMFYRNRLERCYLGASNKGRLQKADSNSTTDPFTSLDPKDSPRLNELCLRPLHIICTTLNITNSKKHLAWQERKAASFTFTPLFCGYEINDTSRTAAYQRTDEYVRKDGGWLSLGTPLTISGAAFSPNAGYHTSTATALLMTIFNARIGWWLQNPHDSWRWQRRGPNWSVPLLLKELIGSTDEGSRFLYLSDGGHFENLGIYELVRRRCRYIIASDTGCDPRFAFEDLGNAIRKIRTDLGIEIRMNDLSELIPDPKTGKGRVHCAVGTVDYGDGKTGYLLYLKSGLTGDEPADITQYAAENPAFPHQSTLDQWYSESQFESYRGLGLHILEEALKVPIERAWSKKNRSDRADGQKDGCDHLASLFFGLEEYWHPTSRIVPGVFSRHGQAVDGIFERLRSDKNLAFLDEQIYTEWQSLFTSAEEAKKESSAGMELPQSGEEIRAGFYFCNSLFQLMENVYLDLDLERASSHPDNRGWMNLFKRWAHSAMVRYTWTICAGTYGARFQSFCRHRLGMEVGDISLNVIASADEIANLPQYAQAPTCLLNTAEVAQIQGFMTEIKKRKEWNDQWKLTVIALELSVPHPYERDLKRGKGRFVCGFAVIKETDKQLVIVSIRNYLRGMGLEHMAVRKLKEEYPITPIALTQEDKSSCPGQGESQQETRDTTTALRLFQSRDDALMRLIKEANTMDISKLWQSVK